MMMTTKTALILATTAAIALANFDLRPAQAAPEGGPAVVKQHNGADEFSAAKKKRRRGRGVNPAVPLAAFGAIVGAIGSIAAANRARDYYYYDDGPYYYGGGPAYVAPQPYYHAPAPYVRHHAPGPRYGGGAGYWRQQRGPLQGQPGHMPATPPQAAPNDGRL
jgi:hypothetical protein